MAVNEVHTEFLFSYGTLQLESVQMATFGRQLTGTSGALQGFGAARSRPSYRVRAFRKCFGMVTLGTDGSRQRTTKILRGPQVLDDAAEVVPRLPSQWSKSSKVRISASPRWPALPVTIVLMWLRRLQSYFARIVAPATQRPDLPTIQRWHDPTRESRRLARRIPPATKQHGSAARLVLTPIPRRPPLSR